MKVGHCLSYLPSGEVYHLRKMWHYIFGHVVVSVVCYTRKKSLFVGLSRTAEVIYQDTLPTLADDKTT